ncbi:MAG: type II toxin-antitoxin system HicB family antitoxin [Candidatus Margulisbacteria bacterium]|nr:type II toxin-antitoxin system HicB family antitoxin [Candidatus Margulisiibacteriota bacterium]MBU1021735.1 type II toxin-antitoxin system HicB family antitoxin [Candidatus Margulisiibacteriota bacterium]MBU1729481.1 type II toxin-antitoxin system HicB family antitoxin [Candidatus Margulisiibacteriota bacterium]MBU1955418.1 type II toxin-antitoxin system HicB family antitoxin [Candidatus Margulisiibacteriota bacterium]
MKEVKYDGARRFYHFPRFFPPLPPSYAILTLLLCYNYPMHLEIKVHTTKEGKFIVQCPTIPGCETEGGNLDEALDKLSDLISANISQKIKKDLKQIFKNLPKNPGQSIKKGIPMTGNLKFNNFPVSMN